MQQQCSKCLKMYIEPFVIIVSQYNFTRDEQSDKENRLSPKNIDDKRDEGVGRDFDQADEYKADQNFVNNLQFAPKLRVPEVHIIGHVDLVCRERETIIEKR